MQQTRIIETGAVVIGKMTKNEVNRIHELCVRLRNVHEHDFSHGNVDTLERLDDIHFLLDGDKTFRNMFIRMVANYKKRLDRKIDKMDFTDKDNKYGSNQE